MLRASIELFPFGDATKKIVSAQIDAANIGKNTDGTTNCLYVVMEPKLLAGTPVDTKGIVKMQDAKS